MKYKIQNNSKLSFRDLIKFVCREDLSNDFSNNLFCQILTNFLYHESFHRFPTLGYIIHCIFKHYKLQITKLQQVVGLQQPTIILSHLSIYDLDFFTR